VSSPASTATRKARSIGGVRSMVVEVGTDAG
jgi:hypothetical protein